MTVCSGHPMVWGSGPSTCRLPPPSFPNRRGVSSGLFWRCTVPVQGCFQLIQRFPGAALEQLRHRDVQRTGDLGLSRFIRRAEDGAEVGCTGHGVARGSRC